jgi:hypothetical protein
VLGELFPQTFDLFARGLALDESVASWEVYDDYGTTLQKFGRFDDSYAVFARAVQRGFIPGIYQRNTLHVPRGFPSRPFWNVNGDGRSDHARCSNGASSSTTTTETTTKPTTIDPEIPERYLAHVRKLRRNHALFKQEFADFLHNRIATSSTAASNKKKVEGGIKAMETQRELVLPSGDWKQLVLWNFGQRLPGCDLVPRTCAIVTGTLSLSYFSFFNFFLLSFFLNFLFIYFIYVWLFLFQLVSVAHSCFLILVTTLPIRVSHVLGIQESISHPHGVISFSMLTPGTHIPSHVGSTGSRLRLHLGIDVTPGCFIRVGMLVFFINFSSLEFLILLLSFRFLLYLSYLANFTLRIHVFSQFFFLLFFTYLR